MDAPGPVSAHLRIPVKEYDARIRTFVPDYEEMLDEAERAVDAVASDGPVVLDLGIGTGALAERCVRARPGATVIGLDSDPAMLEMARARLAGRAPAELRTGSFLEAGLPPCDLLVASLSFHHVADPGEKRRLYAACREAVRAGGAMVLADCYAPSRPELLERGLAAWRRHLERSYTPEEARGHLEAWAGEDTYFPLADELAWLREAGFRPDVLWRRGLNAVVLCA